MDTIKTDPLASVTATDREFLFYLAGFWDGEGSIACQANRYKSVVNYLPYTSLVNTNRAIIEEVNVKLLVLLAGVPGVARVVADAIGDSRGHKTAYRIRQTGRRARAVAHLLAPFLRVKRQQALILASWRFQDSHRMEVVAGVGTRPRTRDPVIVEWQTGAYTALKALNRLGKGR